MAVVLLAGTWPWCCWQGHGRGAAGRDMAVVLLAGTWPAAMSVIVLLLLLLLLLL
jgi:hypothetical protein